MKILSKKQRSKTPSRQHSASSVLGVIPARWGSTRFPGKSLVKICGKPLILWVLERAQQATELDDVLVATDDERIRSVVEEAGGKVAMTRSDHPSGTDRIAEAARGHAADVIINIQGDEPLIEPALIDELALVMKHDRHWDMATAASPILDDEELASPSVVKVVWGQDGQALYFSRSLIPHIREPGPGGLLSHALHWRHIGIYAYRKRFLQKLVKTPVCELENAEKLEQLRALYLGCRMKVVTTKAFGLGVDNPSDVPKAEAMLVKAGLV
jgi:3-deoxy-manno-octulosonate cytidylyltransferase (CMP-KDO synthetase)